MVSGKNRLALLLAVDVDFISIATHSIRLLLLLDALKSWQSGLKKNQYYKLA